VSVILNKKLYMYMCPIPNSFRDRAISLYSPKIIDNKEILRTVSNTGIYCSSDQVGTLFPVDSTVNINAVCISCEDMACCSSVQCTVYYRVKQLCLGNRSDIIYLFASSDRYCDLPEYCHFLLGHPV
jgi:hypothetical protein